MVDLLRITSIDILLSGDNAVVIALATRSLPETQRRIAVIGGSAAAVGLRVAFCLIITSLLRIPYLKLVGGLLLLYIGVKLVIPEGDAHGSGIAAAKSHTWGAIRTILIADAVMSLDNVVAIAAAAHGSTLLIALGLVISIPLIVFGSQLVLRVLNRFAILVVLGGGLLGWIAGETLMSDPAVYTHLPYDEPPQAQIATLCAVLVMATGTVLARRVRAREQGVVDLAPEDQK